MRKMVLEHFNTMLEEIRAETGEWIELNEGMIDFFLFIRGDNRALLDVLNAFYRRGLTFDYEAVVWVVPFLRREDRFKIYNIRRA